MQMLNSILILIIFVLFSFITYCQQMDNPEITAEEIQLHINYLASDGLKGRDSGTNSKDMVWNYYLMIHTFKNFHSLNR